jgi:hypothetical protein
MNNAKKKVEEEKPYIIWDTCRIAEQGAIDRVERAKDDGEELDFDKAFDEACADSDLYDLEWEWTIESLEEVMKEYDKGSGAWYATVENFGWRCVSGQHEFKADNGKDFLHEILPKCDCTFKIFKREGHIAIQNFHHDSCSGNEWYYIYPAKTCSCCGEILNDMNEKKTVEGDYVCEYCAGQYYEDDEICA